MDRVECGARCLGLFLGGFGVCFFVGLVVAGHA